MTIVTPDITRPALIVGLRTMDSTTAATKRYRLGIKNPPMSGLTTWKQSVSVNQREGREKLYGDV